MRLAVAAAVVTVASVAASAPAAGAARRPSATPPGVYRIVFAGGGAYSHAYTSQVGAVAASAQVRWRAVFPRVRLGRGATFARADRRASSLRGTWRVLVDGDARCRASGSLASPGPGVLRLSSDPRVRGGSVLRVTGAAGIVPARPAVGDCSPASAPDFWRDWPSADGVAAHAPLLSAVAPLAPDRHGPVRVSDTPPENPPLDCGTQAESHVSCAADWDWSGTITLTRLRPPRARPHRPRR